MLELVGSVGGLLGDAKAAGESPSQFATEVMNLAVSKAWGDSAGKFPAAGTLTDDTKPCINIAGVKFSHFRRNISCDLF